MIFRLIMLVVVMTLMGCRKEDPSPELLDPIFADLQKRAADAKKSLEDEKKKQEDLKVSIEHAEPNSIDLKNARRDLATSEARSLDFDQKARYYDIRSRRRMYEDRVEYKKAFAKNEQWPDPREYSDYLVNIRLREAPLDWGKRVPKLQDRILNAGKVAEKGKESEKKSEE